MKIDDKINRYVDLRAKVDAFNKKTAEAIAPVKDEMIVIKNEILGQLNDNGLQNFKGSKATAYILKKTSVKAEDWDVFLTFVQEHNLWHMLNRSPSKAATEEYMEETGNLPPGLSSSSMLDVGFRKGK